MRRRDAAFTLPQNGRPSNFFAANSGSNFGIGRPALPGATDRSPGFRAGQDDGGVRAGADAHAPGAAGAGLQMRARLS